jgi:hypothetical protein
MAERRSIYLIACIALFFSLGVPVVLNEKSHIVISASEATEYKPALSEPVREPMTIQQAGGMSVEEHPGIGGVDKFSHIISIEEIMQIGEVSEVKSSCYYDWPLFCCDLCLRFSEIPRSSRSLLLG